MLRIEKIISFICALLISHPNSSGPTAATTYPPIFCVRSPEREGVHLPRRPPGDDRGRALRRARRRHAPIWRPAHERPRPRGRRRRRHPRLPDGVRGGRLPGPQEGPRPEVSYGAPPFVDCCSPNEFIFLRGRNAYIFVSPRGESAAAKSERKMGEPPRLPGWVN